MDLYGPVGARQKKGIFSQNDKIKTVGRRKWPSLFTFYPVHIRDRDTISCYTFRQTSNTRRKEDKREGRARVVRFLHIGQGNQAHRSTMLHDNTSHIYKQTNVHTISVNHWHACHDLRRDRLQ